MSESGDYVALIWCNRYLSLAYMCITHKIILHHPFAVLKNKTDLTCFILLSVIGFVNETPL